MALSGGRDDRRRSNHWHSRLEPDGSRIKVVLLMPFHSVQEVRGNDPRSGARVSCSVLSGGVVYRCASPTLRLNGWEATFPDSFMSAPGVHPPHGGFHEVTWTIADGTHPSPTTVAETFYTNVDGVLLAGGAPSRLSQSMRAGLATMRELFRRS